MSSYSVIVLVLSLLLFPLSKIPDIDYIIFNLFSDFRSSKIGRWVLMEALCTRTRVNS